MANYSENREYVGFVTAKFNLVRWLRLHGFTLSKEHGVWIVREIGDQAKTKRATGHSEKI